MSQWKVEKIVLPIMVAAAALILVLGALKETEEENLQKRLDKWRAVLPTDIRAQFDAANDDACARMIDERLKADAAFKKRYEALQDEELTPIFTPRDMVDYYRVYFVGRINELRAGRGDKNDIKNLESYRDQLKPGSGQRLKFDRLLADAKRNTFFQHLFHGNTTRQPLS
jgi:hypothetical protein